MQRECSAPAPSPPTPCLLLQTSPLVDIPLTQSSEPTDTMSFREEVADGVLRVLEFVAAHEDGGHLVEVGACRCFKSGTWQCLLPKIEHDTHKWAGRISGADTEGAFAS